MPDIFHHFPINAPSEKVFESISTPKGLDRWWSESARGKAAMGEKFHLSFGPGYNWSAVVTKFIYGKEFELTMLESDSDWEGSKVGFNLAEVNGVTQVRFYHTGWKEANEHYKISTYCWAMYLRILKRNLEFGEEVAYKDRLNV